MFFTKTVLGNNLLGVPQRNINTSILFCNTIMYNVFSISLSAIEMYRLHCHIFSAILSTNTTAKMLGYYEKQSVVTIECILLTKSSLLILFVFPIHFTSYHLLITFVYHRYHHFSSCSFSKTDEMRINLSF